MTEIDLTPITRLEYDIDAILNDHAVAEPITRIELILADIVAGNTTTVVPVTRIETYLAIISGADYPVPEPVTRIETFLAIIAGADYETPEAVTRLEGLLAEWVEKGSGIWKTVTGSLIHITDALASPMRKCEVTLEPIQDLHGQDAPYPAGGGKNKFGDYTIANGYIEGAGTIAPNADDRTYIVPISAETTYSIKIARTNAAGSIWNDDVQIGEFYSDERPTAGSSGGTRIKAGGYVGNLYQSTFTTSANAKWLAVKVGNISVTDVDATAATVQLEVGESVSAEYSPYSNICPIEGWTGANVYNAGENIMNALAGFQYLKENYFSTQLSIDTSAKTVTFSPSTAPGIYQGIIVEATKNAKQNHRPYYDFKQNTRYTFIFKAETAGASSLNIAVSYTDGTNSGGFGTSDLNSDGYIVYTTTAGKTVRSLYIGLYGGVSTYYYETFACYEGVVTYQEYLEKINTPARIIPISWQTEAGTVYGCKLGVVSGVLTVETATVDMASINWVSITVNGVDRIATAQIQNILTPRSDYYPPDGLHEVYKLVTVAAIGQNEYAACIGSSGYGYGDRLIINDPRITDPSQAPTVLSGIKFMYYLKEPIEIQLTPQEISTLKGENNVWSNSNGDTTIIYKAQSE